MKVSGDAYDHGSLDYRLTVYEQNQVSQIREGNDPLTALCLLSAFGNGYVREAAVLALAEQPSLQTLLALLERLDDWVPQVRQHALVALESYLQSKRVDWLLQALTRLMALVGKQRFSQGDTLVRIRALLMHEQVRPQVMAAFVGYSSKSARFIFELLLASDMKREVLLELALTHREMTVRKSATDACGCLTATTAVPMLEKVLKASAGSLRVKALRVLLKCVGDPREYLRAALLDRAAAMRLLARWEAPRWGLSAQDVLVERLEGDVPTSKAEWLGVIGLARELKAPQAGSMLRRALSSPFASVRLAALEALGDKGLAQQIAALDDPSDKVFTAAVGLLAQQVWADFADELEAHLYSARLAAVEKRFMALLRLKPGWLQVEYLLRRLDAAVTDSAYWVNLVNRWCDEQYGLVDPVTPKALRANLLVRLDALEVAGQLSPGSVGRLR